MLVIIILMLLSIFVYLLPGIIATRRKHKNAAPIWIVDIFLGWTGVGWVVALAWACANKKAE